MTAHLDALNTLAQSGTEAKVKLAHNPAGLNQASQALGQAHTAIGNASGVAQGQRVQLAANAEGQTADRAVANSANLEKSLEQVKGQATEIQTAVQQVTDALHIAEKTNQDKLDQFVREATSIMSAVAAIKSVDPQAAQTLLTTKLAELGRRLDIDVQSNLKNIDGTLAQIAAALSAGGRTGGGGASGGGQAPPRAFNNAGSGGGTRASSGGGGSVRKPRLPMAIPPQPGTGVDINLPNGKTVQAPNETAAKAVRSALSNLGVPYVWGGTAQHQGLDCSGLTMTSYGDAGLILPRKSNMQTIGAEVPSIDQLLPGDLVVWSGHVAMVVGDGMMIEAGDPVQLSPIRTTNAGQSFIGFYRPTG